MANPLVPQGVINRLRASIVFVQYTNLNITASFLGKEGISLSFEGQATTPIETMTGVVQAPEPYQRVALKAHLLKTQFLANAFKYQIETTSLIGDAVVRADSSSLTPYQLSNVAIQTVDPLKFDGTDAGWTINFSGIYYINSALWNV